MAETAHGSCQKYYATFEVTEMLALQFGTSESKKNTPRNSSLYLASYELTGKPFFLKAKQSLWKSGIFSRCSDAGIKSAPLQRLNNIRMTGVSVNGWLTTRFANDIGDTFWPHLCRVLTPRQYFTVIAGSECLSLVVAGHSRLAAQHHDPHVKVVRVQLFGGPGRLTAVHNLETLAPEIAFECLPRQRAVAASAR
jgi:hypothetical protein